MILTTAITWAILATGGGIWAALGWRWQALRYESCNRQRIHWIERYNEGRADRLDSVGLKIENVQLKEQVRLERELSIDLEDRLREIEQQRHLSAKHARQAQLSQQRAKVLAKASELTPVPVDTRKAA
jgi:hypothetical protein